MARLTNPQLSRYLCLKGKVLIRCCLLLAIVLCRQSSTIRTSEVNESTVLLLPTSINPFKSIISLNKPWGFGVLGFSGTRSATSIFRGPDGYFSWTRARRHDHRECVCGASGRGALSCKPKRRTTKTQYPRVRLRKRSVPEWCADRAHGSVHVLTCPRSRKSKHNTTLTRCPTLYKRKVTAALWVNAAPFLSHSLRACTSDASSRNRRAARLTVEMHAYTGPMPPHIWRAHTRFSRHFSYPTRASRIISDCEQ